MSLAVYFTELMESLSRELEYINANEYTAQLYTNNVDPNSETELDDFDLATATWATPIDLDEWDPEAVTYDAPRAVAVHPQITWTPDGSGSETVYGFVVLNGLGALAWSEQFTDGPYTVGPGSSKPLSITPKRTRRSEFHSEPP